MMPVKSKSKKSRRSTSLTATLTFAFAVLSIFSMLLVGIFQTARNFQAQQAVAIGQQRLIALNAADEVAAFVEQIFDTLEAVAQVSRSSSGTMEEQQLILENLMILQPALREVALLDQQGREVVKQSRLEVVAPEDLTNQAGSDLFAQVSQGQRYVSSVYLAETTVEPLVSMAVPIKDPFGDFAGAVVAEVNLKFMWDLVASLEVGQSGQAYVVDETGNLIAFEDVSRILRGENLRDLDEVAEFMIMAGQIEGDLPGPDVSVGITGNRVLATHVHLNKPNWAVVAELPLTEAYQGVFLELGVSLLVILVGAILAAVAGVYLSRRLAAPLLNLTETAAQIAGGKLDLVASPEGTTEVGQLAEVFNSMTGQLRRLIASLELQVRRLGIAATLNERLSAILNLEMLLAEVVNQVQDSFNYYHTHIYLLDNRGEQLVVAEGAGEAGRQMKASGHSIPLDAPASLVARAARSGELVRVDNAREEADWLPNELLPDTRAEMAVPIVLDGQVVGVLDVQSNEIGGLDEGDANMLRSLANQVAVAIRNANLFAEVEGALAEARAAQARYTDQAWQAVQLRRPEYNYQRADAAPLPEETLVQLKHAALTKAEAAIASAENSRVGAGSTPDPDPDRQTQNQPALVAPIKVQNQVVGTMHFLENDPARQHPWTEQEIALVQAIADQVAQSAENLRLFEQVQERASRERLIGQITDKLRRAPSMEALLETGVSELALVLGTGRTYVRFGSPDELQQATLQSGSSEAQPAGGDDKPDPE